MGDEAGITNGFAAEVGGAEAGGGEKGLNPSEE
jgi:hypothetical protein